MGIPRLMICMVGLVFSVGFLEGSTNQRGKSCDLAAAYRKIIELKKMRDTILLSSLALVESEGKYEFIRDRRILASLTFSRLYRRDGPSNDYLVSYSYAEGSGQEGFLAVTELIKRFLNSSERIVSSFKIQRPDYDELGFQIDSFSEHQSLDFFIHSYTLNPKPSTKEVFDGTERAEMLYDVYEFKKPETPVIAK